MSAFATDRWQGYQASGLTEHERTELRDAARALGWCEEPRATPRAFPTMAARAPLAGAAPASAPPRPALAVASPIAARPAAARPASPAAVPANLPPRALSFPEYLFHRGLVAWAHVTEALRWHREQRPTVGQIAVEWGYLAPEDVRAVLEQRRRERAYGVPFCEFACRAGFLTRAQVTAVLGQQRRLEPPDGRYFVLEGILSQRAVDELLAEHRGHNARWANREAAPGAR